MALSLKYLITARILAIVLIALPKFSNADFDGHNFYTNGSICQAYYGENRSEIQNTQHGAWNYNLSSPVWVTCPITFEQLDSTKGTIAYYIGLKHNNSSNNKTTCFLNVVEKTGTLLFSNAKSWTGGSGQSTRMHIGSYRAESSFSSATVSCFLAANAYIMGVDATAAIEGPSGNAVCNIFDGEVENISFYVDDVNRTLSTTPVGVAELVEVTITSPAWGDIFASISLNVGGDTAGMGTGCGIPHQEIRSETFTGDITVASGAIWTYSYHLFGFIQGVTLSNFVFTPP